MIYSFMLAKEYSVGMKLPKELTDISLSLEMISLVCFEKIGFVNPSKGITALRFKDFAGEIRIFII